MNVNFGSLIPIRAIHVVNNTVNGKMQTIRNVNSSVLSTLSKRINRQKPEYVDKLLLIDKDFINCPYAVTIRNETGFAYLLTGKSAEKFRNDTDEYYRTAGESKEPDKEKIIREEKSLYDKTRKRIHLDLFVKKQGQKMDLVDIKLVTSHGGQPILYDIEENGQLLLPLNNKH